MAAAMGGLDVLVFTGGIGEHQPAGPGRGRGRPGLPRRSDRPGPQQPAAADAEIAAAAASVRTLVVTAREDLEIARQVRTVLGLAAMP